MTERHARGVSELCYSQTRPFVQQHNKYRPAVTRQVAAVVLRVVIRRLKRSRLSLAQCHAARRGKIKLADMSAMLNFTSFLATPCRYDKSI